MAKRSDDAALPEAKRGRWSEENPMPLETYQIHTPIGHDQYPWAEPEMRTMISDLPIGSIATAPHLDSLCLNPSAFSLLSPNETVAPSGAWPNHATNSDLVVGVDGKSTTFTGTAAMDVDSNAPMGLCVDGQPPTLEIGSASKLEIVCFGMVS
jgi:hypothetical protein